MAPVKAKKKGSSKAREIGSAINAQLGSEVLKLGTDKSFRIERIPSGSLTIDRITGGGFALGRHVELYGSESSAKSYIGYRTIALSQARGNVCALIDPEHVFDGEWFSHLGGKTSDLLISHPADSEEAVAVMMMLAQSAEEGSVEVAMLDSIASLVTQEEMKTDPRQVDRLGSLARAMSRALRRITAVNKKTLFIWTNQERMNIGVVFGNPKTSPGGRAMRFYATTRIDMQKSERIKEKKKVAKKSKLMEVEMPVGNWVQVRAEKEKSTKPYGQGAFIFDTERGEIDQVSEIIQLSLEDGTIVREGNTFIYEGIEETVKGQGKAFANRIRDDDELRAELIESIEDQTQQRAKI